MRTSRIARDTARFVTALSPSSTRSRRGHTARNNVNESSKADEYDQTRSPPSLSPLDNLDASPSSPSASSTRKRKRGADTVTSLAIDDAIVTTTSPRGGKAPNTAKPKKARRQPAKKVVAQDGGVKIEPPANWERIYNLTREMRSERQAPVDTMGCEALAEEHRSPRDKRFQTLISLMLSSQTKDTVNAVAMKNLQENLPGGLTIESILAVEPATLNEMIVKVGFHNNKTKFIKAAAEILRTTYDSDIPSTIDGLVSLPGVGPKMAYLCMSAAWGRDEGIGVDVHVHRITNLWGWHKTKEPEGTRAMLESWLPRDKWHDINTLLVGFGQTWCPPVGRKCEECRLSGEGLCPSAVVSKAVKGKVKKEKNVVKSDAEEPSINGYHEVDVEAGTIKKEEFESPKTSSSMNGVVQDIEDLGGLSRRPRRLAR